MNIIFAGYRKWSYQILKNLLKTPHEKWNIAAILTTPEEESHFETSSVARLSVKTDEFDKKETLQKITKFKPDVFLYYGWSWMIPKAIYKNHLCLVLHPSPLPKYRGGSPIQNQIIAGETKSAVSIIQTIDKIDAGDIYSQTEFPLSGSLEEIFSKIVKIGSRDTIKLLDRLATGSIQPTKQDLSQGSYYKRRKPNESELTIEDLQNKTSEELYNFIRALTDPYPNAFIKCKDGKKLFITEAKIEKNENKK